jgi:hypothetical protein
MNYRHKYSNRMTSKTIPLMLFNGTLQYIDLIYCFLGFPILTAFNPRKERYPVYFQSFFSSTATFSREYSQR